MNDQLTPARAALGGAAVLMACACGAATGSAKLVALAGMGATTMLLYPIFIAFAGLLIVYGLWQTSRMSAYLALGGFAVLAAGTAIAPPMVVIYAKALPWSPAQAGGAVLYVLAAGMLGYALWRAFPSPNPTASAAAIGGAALATGCTCCLVTGAVAGLVVTAGGSSAVFESTPILFWTGLAVTTLALLRLGGVRSAVWVPIGGMVVKFGPEVLKLGGEWMVAGVNLRFLPAYLITLAGTATIMYGFGLAYRSAGARRPEPVWRPVAGEPALG